MINFEQYRTTELRTSPWPWAQLVDVIAPDTMALLCRTFPTSGFVLRNGGPEDPYRTLGRRLIHLGADDLATRDGLDPIWIKFAEALLSPAYRNAMAGLTGLDLGTAGLQVSIYRNGPSCWLPAHIDEQPKIVTQTFYFNERWEPDWGGDLLILASEDENDVAARITPFSSHSAIIVAVENSWHAVMPRMDKKVADVNDNERRSMVIQFYDRPELWRDKYRGNPLGSAFEKD